jgi:charged multivesicular body protein 2A
MGLGDLFHRKTPQELVRENQRLIQKSVRELDREKASLEAQEKRIIADIKKNAKNNQMNSVRILAKDLVRTRRYIEKFINMKAHLQAVNLRLQTMKSNQSIAQAMMGITKAMKTMNRRINLPSIQKIMMDFEKQNMTMELKEEMMNDSIDDALNEEGEEEETDEIVNKVLDEIGISMSEQLGSVPSSMVGSNSLSVSGGQRVSASPMTSSPESDLEARLMNLKR